MNWGHRGGRKKLFELVGLAGLEIGEGGGCRHDKERTRLKNQSDEQWMTKRLEAQVRMRALAERRGRSKFELESKRGKEEVICTELGSEV